MLKMVLVNWLINVLGARYKKIDDAVNPMDSQEAKVYEMDDIIQSLLKLKDFYDRNDVNNIYGILQGKLFNDPDLADSKALIYY